MIMRALVLAAFCLALATRAMAEDITVLAVPVETFKGAELDQRVDGLIWRGGIRLTSDAMQFGGLSGIAFTTPEQRLAFVSDDRSCRGRVRRTG